MIGFRLGRLSRGGVSQKSGKGQCSTKSLTEVDKNIRYTMIDYFELRSQGFELRRAYDHCQNHWTASEGGPGFSEIWVAVHKLCNAGLSRVPMSWYAKDLAASASLRPADSSISS